MFNGNNTPFTMPVMPANTGGYGNGGAWGDGGWLWIIVVFALLFGWGNNGWGGFGGGNGGGYVATAATQADIADLFTCVWDALCNVFGIHSPAETMKPIGRYIVLGIIEGLSNTIDEFIGTLENFASRSIA